jgi:ATP-binding cassette, subfamily C, bacterial
MDEFIRLFIDLRLVFGLLRLTGLAALMAVVGLTEGLAILLLLPLLSRLGIASSAPSSGVATSLLGNIDGWTGHRIGPLIVMIVVTVLVSSGLYLLQSWLLAATAHRYAAGWKERQLRAFFGAGWSFISAHKSGELLNSIITEPGRLAAATQNMASLAASLIISTIYIGYALLLSWQATLLLLLGCGCLVISIRRLYDQSRSIGATIGPLNAKQQVMIGEFLQSAKLVKAAGIEDVAVDRSTAVVRELELTERRMVFMPSLVRGLFEAAGLIMLVLLLVLSSEVLGTTAANLLVVFALFLRLFPRLTGIQLYIHCVVAYAPAVMSVRSLYEESLDKAEAPQASTGLQRIPERPGSIEIRGLVTEYDGRKVLDGVDLSVPIPGFVALLGPSGAGKSTLLSNLLRLVAWREGSIGINNISLLDIDLRQWRRSIGYMPQETILFHASIRENIALLNPDATPAMIELACKRAQLTDFIRDSEHGLETVVGDQGIRLSGGQRQRLGLARALLCNPRLLLLDEATSALDATTEREILEQLRELAREIGILFVTHRESVADYADRVYVLDQGRVVETSGRRESVSADRARG